MSDKLKLADGHGDAEIEKISHAKEMDELNRRVRELEQNVARLKAQHEERARVAREAAATKAAGNNKIGARKHAGFKAISTAPSINKTPIGPSMVPLPYPTVQDLSNSTSTARSVRFNGAPAYLLDGTTQPKCKGDEPGTGKGIRSGTVSGEVKPVKGSSTVRIEGKQVVREGDACTMNGGNNPGIYVTTQVPSSAPPKDAIKTSNPQIVLDTHEEKSTFMKIVEKAKEHVLVAKANVKAAFDRPIEGAKGIVKGIVNIVPSVTELVLKGAALSGAAQVAESEATLTVVGQTELAKKQGALALEMQEAASNVSVPKLPLSNAAQEGGDTISVLASVIAGGVGILKSGARLLGGLGKAGKAAEAAKAAEVASGASKIEKVAGAAGGQRGDGVKIIAEEGGFGLERTTAAGATYGKLVDRIPGKIISESDALSVGPLGDDLAGLPGTFSGGRYATMKLDHPMTLYRAWAPGQAREFGAFWALEKPVGALQTRIDSALLPEWGTIRGTPFSAQATQYTVIELPAGSVIHVGEVGSQGGAWIGGKSQILIDGGAKAEWKIGGGVLR